MKKVLGLMLLAITTLSVEARVIRLTGNGGGGTTNGDREAACGRAYDRAEVDAYNQCDDRFGEVLDSTQGSCSCRKKPGSRDDYHCDATVRVSCEVACRPQQIQLSGTGLGLGYDRSAACSDAFRRAENDTQYSCSRRGGFILYTDEQSCNCRRLSGGDYECRSQVVSTCELQDCH